jgi:hypothetical protein
MIPTITSYSILLCHSRPNGAQRGGHFNGFIIDEHKKQMEILNAATTIINQ